MHGREARIPADLMFGDPSDEEQDHDFVSRQREHLQQAFQLVRQHTGKEARRRKDRYDLRTKPQKFQAGSKVWCYVPRRYKGKYQKWRSLYQGPFVVTRQLAPVTYEIRRSINSRPLVVHIDKLKPCSAEEDAQPTTTRDVSADTDVPSPTVNRPHRAIQRPRCYLD